MSEPIRVWKFHEAPAELRVLSEHGGDEDWVAVFPPEFDKEDWVGWCAEYSSFGCAGVSTHDHPYLDGWHVRIGAHA